MAVCWQIDKDTDGCVLTDKYIDSSVFIDEFLIVCWQMNV